MTSGRQLDRPLLFGAPATEHAHELTRAFQEQYFKTLDSRPVAPVVDRSALRALTSGGLPDDGTPLDVLYDELERTIVPNCTHTAHPRFIPYVQPSPNGLMPFADAVVATLNQNCNLWTLSPAANAIEQVLVRWFGELFGIAGAAGLLTSGGSAANFIALAAARDRTLGADARTRGLQGRNSPLTLYTSDQTHSSIAKAVAMLGLGTDSLRIVESDGACRIRLDRLESAIASDLLAGATPFCVVGNAGTVTTGAVDPIGELAALARAHGMWLHVDGAYGALTALSPRFRPLMEDLRLADSLSLDPHKFLFCSFDAGCVLVRERSDLLRSFSTNPSYLSMPSDDDFIDYANYGPQLSRSFRALKVWWSLRHFGRRAYAEVIESMADLALQMAREVERQTQLEALCPVTLNCFCFRRKDLDDAGNLRVLDELTRSGFALLGPARVHGVTGLRACFMNLRTRPSDVSQIVERIARMVV
jgi:aromatic-L-amino-acid/L-tryptophan decarboxylase